jgi:hypothetical protein
VEVGTTKVERARYHVSIASILIIPSRYIVEIVQTDNHFLIIRLEFNIGSISLVLGPGKFVVKQTKGISL